MSSHNIPNMPYGRRVRGTARPVYDPCVPQGLSGTICSVWPYVVILEDVSWYHVHEMSHPRVYHFSTYRHTVIVPRTITVPVLPSYAIAPHTIISRVRQICLLSISDGCALSPIRLRTRLRLSDYFKRRSDWTRQWTSQNATVSVALHQTSFCCLCGCAKSTHCTGTRARSPSVSNLFPLVRGNTLLVTASRRLFATVTFTIRRSSFAVVHLEGPVPGFLATLFLFRLCTTFFTGTALQPSLWAMWLYDAPVSLIPVIRPFLRSDRWR